MSFPTRIVIRRMASMGRTPRTLRMLNTVSMGRVSSGQQDQQWANSRRLTVSLVPSMGQQAQYGQRKLQYGETPAAAYPERASAGLAQPVSSLCRLPAARTGAASGARRSRYLTVRYSRSLP